MIENNSLIVVMFNICRAGTGRAVVEEYLVGCTVAPSWKQGVLNVRQTGHFHVPWAQSSAVLELQWCNSFDFLVIHNIVKMFFWTFCTLKTLMME